MNLKMFTEEQLWDIARTANAASGANEYPHDPRSVESLLIWADDSRAHVMTEWQRAAWARAKELSQ